MQEQIEAYILKEISKIASEPLVHPSGSTELYGKNGLLNSFQLVTLIVELEDWALSQFNCQITIADDKAFSMHNSPFSTVSTLAYYVKQLLHEYQQRA